MTDNCADITVFNGYDKQPVEILWQKEVVLDIDAALFYIKSGEKEIQTYVDEVAKPDIQNFTRQYAAPIVASVVTEQSAALINAYVEDNTKPEIAAYAAEVVQPYSTAAAADARSAAESSAAAASKAETAAQSANDAAASQNAAAESALAAADSMAEIKNAAVLSIGDIGIAPFGIDESENKRRYLNGQLIVQEQFAAFTLKLKAAVALHPSLALSEEDWQAEKSASKLGQCGKFVIDDANGTIRLPAVININGLADLSTCGALKTESLPNISGTLTQNCVMYTAAASGSLAAEIFEGYTSGAYASGFRNSTLSLDASQSSETYQTGAAVRQEAVQYPYFIQVATGVDETVRPINNYQVNNVFAFGMNQYCRGELNNNSWLKSAGQWNSGAVYGAYYQWAQEQLGAGADGFASAAGEYDDYDFVLNTLEQTFRLPLKTPIAANLPSGYSLYYYIGDTLQNAQLVNVARLQETISGLQQKINALQACRHVVESYHNGAEWYCLYSDGWIEQGGAVSVGSGWEVKNLLKPFSDTSYYINCYMVSGGSGTNNYFGDNKLNGRTETTFTVGTGQSEGSVLAWFACGY